MKNKIFYVGFYNHESILKDKRFDFPAATSKMDYIIDLLDRIKLDTIVINPSWTNSKNFVYGKEVKITKCIRLKTFYSIPWSNRLFKSISSRLMKFQLFLYLFINVKKQDKIIVYHSIFYSKIFTILKKLKKMELILEVEEIYQDINKLNQKEINRENKIFNMADKYIYSTELMKDKISREKKNITISGNYLIKPNYYKKFNDKKIHFVYAGIIDKQKKGAFEIFNIAKKFSEDYVFHVLGFGKEKDIEDLKNKIESFNKNNLSNVEYNGLLKNKELDAFLQKCDIGLSCQTPIGKYNNSSFPSKIINYLTNGLEVITIDIPAIRVSKVGNIVHYYQKNKYDQVLVESKKILKAENKVINQLILIDKCNLTDMVEFLGEIT